MLIRPKLFLTFLGLCLVPLLLLALVNYWNGVLIANATLRRDQESELAAFKGKLSDLLSRDQNELTQLAASKPLQNYVRIRSEEGNSFGTTSNHAQALADQANTSATVPAELKVRLASILNSRGDLASISLFDHDKRPILFAERQPNDANEPVTFQTRDFLPAEAKPDDRVWSAPARTAFNSDVSTGPLGPHVDCTIPVFSERQDGNKLQGALVGQLKLDLILSEAAKGNRALAGGPLANGSATKQVPALFVVLDRAGRILYHSNQALKHQQVAESMPYFQPVAHQMFANETGNESFSSPGGDKYLASYSRIPGLNISVAVASNYKQAVADARRGAWTGFIVAFLLGALAAVLLTVYFQRKTRGIERVREGVEAIAKGKLDHRIELPSSDNLRPIADNVDLMTKQLRDQIAREAESRQFESFVRLSAILTHDLKNAIEALSLIVANMERHFDNKEFREDAMKSLTGATGNLRALVARLSNPVTTLSGEHKRPKPVDLVPMLKRVISMTAEPARVNHRIKIDLPESLLALVDIERMNKVVENLIINALEAMGQRNGTLTIAAGKTDEGKSFFSVSDTGVGMNQRFIEEQLFHPFATTKKRGVGLGLYTCREVVMANGGSIQVDSREGAGTTFRVVLPSAAIDTR